jgi:DNA-binding protein HU-beta
MNKGELVDAIAEKTNAIATKKVIESVLNATIDTVIETVAGGDRVVLVGFGSFESRQRKEREGRNPRTGDRMVIPPTTVPAFQAGKLFKDKVN